MTARDRILARRAQMMAAALAGVVGCHDPPSAKSGNVATAPTNSAGALAEKALAGDTVPKKEKPLDTDGDGIPDVDDKCPDVAGSVLKEGCPSPCLSVVSPTSIVIHERIYFPDKSAKLQPTSKDVLDALAQALVGNPQIAGVEVQGHIDKSEPAGLGEKRAKAVRDALVNRNVNPTRLTVRDMGSANPADNGTTTDAKQKNRRVEFLVLP